MKLLVIDTSMPCHPIFCFSNNHYTLTGYLDIKVLTWLRVLYDGYDGSVNSSFLKGGHLVPKLDLSSSFLGNPALFVELKYPFSESRTSCVHLGSLSPAAGQMELILINRNT